MSSGRFDFNVAVIGGGIVGSALACGLGKAGLDLVLVDSGKVPQRAPTGAPELRVSAVTLASRSVFRALEVWSDIEATRLAPYRDMVVWDSGGPGQIEFHSADVGVPCLGWIIENAVVQWALAQRIQRLANVEVMASHSLLQVDPDEEGVTVLLDDGTRFRVRLLIGADGGRSRVRSQASIESTGWSYEQSALVATVETEKPNAETAWQRFLPTGPLAFLPLFNGHSSIVWSTHSDEAKRLSRIARGEFEAELTDAFEGRLGSVELRSKRAAFPLHLRYARNYVRPRIALAGDAAHTVHPLAGQGVNLGILDAAALCEVVTRARASNRDIGSLHTLRRYERWRKGDNMLMLGALDGIKRLFGSQAAVARLGRSLGLNATDQVRPLKNALARRAMGLGGDLPPMARSPVGGLSEGRATSG